MKKLLILGGSRYIIPAIEAAHKLGAYVVTCDYLPDNIGHKYSDEYHNVSIIDKEAILALARELKIDGILSYATDPGVEPAAYVAEQLGLPTPPYESVRILQNKDLFRQFLKDHDFNVPLFRGFASIEEAEAAIGDFTMPVIVKPVDSAGSKGVARVDKKEDLRTAIEHALTYSHSGRFIIEEFIEKECYSSGSECFSVQNRIVFTSFANQHFDKSCDNPYTPMGSTWPSYMPKECQMELRNELQRLISLLHMGTTIYNVECRLGTNGKTYLMEVSPRAGGNRLAEVLRYACGQDLILNDVKAALGLPADELTEPIYRGSWGVYMLHSDAAGIFDHLWISPEVEDKYVAEKDLWIQPGQEVHPFTGANEAVGSIIFHCNSAEEANTLIEHHRDWCRVVVRANKETAEAERAQKNMWGGHDRFFRVIREAAAFFADLQGQAA